MSTLIESRASFIFIDDDFIDDDFIDDDFIDDDSSIDHLDYEDIEEARAESDGSRIS